MKMRARRYIAAGREEWLYPEQYISKSDWARFGSGYLLMPDPRSVPFKGEMYMGFGDGSSTAFDEYGRRPWESGFGRRSADERGEWHTFNKFRGEFARLQGPYRRGRAYHIDRLDPEKDSDMLHNSFLNYGRRKRR